MSAFVLFRSMEGVERALVGFQHNRFFRYFFSVFYCCTPKLYRKKLFRDKWIKVKRAVEPELLIWENFGVTKKSRFVRILLYLIFVVFMLGVCFFIIGILEKQSDNAQELIPNVQCPEVVDASAANLDYIEDNRNGDFHCFCKSLFFSDGLRAIKTF